MIHLIRGENEDALRRFRTAADTAEPDRDYFVQFIVKYNALQVPVLNEPEFVAIRSELAQ